MSSRVILVTRFHFLLLLVILAITVTAFLRVPQIDLPVHWGLDGNPDVVWPKTQALLVMPLAGALLTALFFLTGWFSTRERIEPGRSVLEAALAGVLLLFAAVQAGLLLIGIGSDIDMIRIVAGGVAVLLLLLGMELPRSEPNALIGIRLPWTRSSPAAWRLAHRVAGVLFFVAGVGLALSAWLWPEPATLVPILLAAVLGPCIAAALLSLLFGRGQATP